MDSFIAIWTGNDIAGSQGGEDRIGCFSELVLATKLNDDGFFRRLWGVSEKTWSAEQKKLARKKSDRCEQYERGKSDNQNKKAAMTLVDMQNARKNTTSNTRFVVREKWTKNVESDEEGTREKKKKQFHPG